MKILITGGAGFIGLIATKNKICDNFWNNWIFYEFFCNVVYFWICMAFYSWG